MLYCLIDICGILFSTEVFIKCFMFKLFSNPKKKPSIRRLSVQFLPVLKYFTPQFSRSDSDSFVFLCPRALGKQTGHKWAGEGKAEEAKKLVNQDAHKRHVRIIKKFFSSRLWTSLLWPSLGPSVVRLSLSK